MGHRGGEERAGYLGQPRALAYSTACSSPSRKAACLPGTAPSPISPFSRSPAERTELSARLRRPAPASRAWAPRRTRRRVDQHQLQPRFPRRARQRLRRLFVRPGDLGGLEARAAGCPQPCWEAGELGEQPRHIGREAERSHDRRGARGRVRRAGRRKRAGRRRGRVRSSGGVHCPGRPIGGAREPRVRIVSYVW